MVEEGRTSFFGKKRSRKTFANLAPWPFHQQGPIAKVFCFFFSKKKFLLSYYATALIALTVIGVFLPQPIIGQFGIGYGVQLDRFVALACMQGVVYFFAVFASRFAMPSLWFVLAVAVLMRVAPLLAPPFLSNDMYRYIWDGWVQSAGINPYRYIPADAHLAFLRDQVIYPNINRATYAHTIYPPAAEMIFWAITQVKLPAVLGMKLCLLGFEALGVFATIRLLDAARLPRGNILIYAWNPLPVWEFASSGHVDAIAVGFVALALLFAATSRPVRAALALGLATLTKFLPVILLPVLWRRWDWRFAACFTGVVVLLYVPFLGVGGGVFGFLGGYGAQEGIASGNGIFLLSVVARVFVLPDDAAKIYLAVLACALLALAAAMVFGRAGPVTPRVLAGRFMLLAGLVMLELSPHYPWYFAWLLIPACILPASSILYLVTASFLLYLNPTHTRLFWPAFVYLPFIALALRDLWPDNFLFATSRRLAEGDHI
jgi:hypothetical protein